MKPIINGPLRTSIKDGDPYIDKPVYKTIPVYCGKEPMVGRTLQHYKRTPLRWMKPVNGKLVPR
jgi:hypothetical protein